MISAWVTGDVALIAKFDSMPQGIHTALEKSVNRMAIKLLGHVKQEKLSDQVLRVRTGRLRRSITERVTTSGSSVTAVVGTNVEYAARHEYGYSGPENVKAHLRLITKAFGRPITPQEVMVNPFVRNVNLPERSFLRSALADMREEITTDMTNAIVKAVK